MTRQRLYFILGLMAISMLVAFVLRNAIYEAVIVPLAYLWWQLGLYYHLIPQVLLWGILIFFILVSVIRGLLLEIPIGRKIFVKREPVQGRIESLYRLVNKRKRGNYYKWLIANRLGKIARELLDQREGRLSGKRFGKLIGKDWEPAKEIENYLEAGLNGSFADFPQPSKFNPQPTPLDVNPGEVIEYLESEMENNRNGHR